MFCRFRGDKVLREELVLVIGGYGVYRGAWEIDWFGKLWLLFLLLRVRLYKTVFLGLGFHHDAFFVLNVTFDLQFPENEGISVSLINHGPILLLKDPS